MASPHQILDELMAQIEELAYDFDAAPPVILAEMRALIANTISRVVREVEGSYR